MLAADDRADAAPATHLEPPAGHAPKQLAGRRPRKRDTREPRESLPALGVDPDRPLTRCPAGAYDGRSRDDREPVGGRPGVAGRVARAAHVEPRGPCWGA